MRISDWSSDVCSSDLAELHPAIHPDAVHHLDHAIGARLDHHARPFGVRRTVGKPGGEPSPIIGRHAIGEIHALCPGRSEEHTSELQSLMRISYAVFCLKQNKNKTTNHNTITH